MEETFLLTIQNCQWHAYRLYIKLPFTVIVVEPLDTLQFTLLLFYLFAVIITTRCLKGNTNSQ